MDIRDVETIIDKAHEQNIVFRAGKKQTTYDLLASFEDICGSIFMGSVLNPLALQKIIEQMDALNVALWWADQLCSEDQDTLFTVKHNLPGSQKSADFPLETFSSFFKEL